jgi:malonate-semialdehyde dehydrogenase (acetylating)/methylmalonate-semialdehyde dehydrogenase
MKRISHWVGGKSVLGESGRTAPVYDPALGEQTAEVDLATADEVDAAVAVARSALASSGSGSCSTPTATGSPPP